MDNCGRLRYANDRRDVMHALRHYYAGVLLADGVSIRELAEYLGHSDPRFTLRTYIHMLPDSHERAIKAINARHLRPQPVANRGDAWRFVHSTSTALVLGIRTPVRKRAVCATSRRASGEADGRIRPEDTVGAGRPRVAREGKKQLSSLMKIKCLLQSNDDY
ncbi:tyrosine-type recombinase/integrase [Actinospica robiniae]|uniref:tyrosine-type recombinase/integrase n=1 Tax=Actinospica robiniae TaxID=304901 RepID=UPI0009FCA8A1